MEECARRRLALLSSHVNPPAETSLPTFLVSSRCASDANVEMNKGHDDCVFCKIIRGDSPAFKLYEDDECICVLDSYPLCYGHSLIIPKCHYPSLDATPPSVFFDPVIAFIYSSFILPCCDQVCAIIFRIENAGNIHKDIIGAMCSKVPLISKAVMKATGCDSFNLLVNNGAAAGQVIFHTHIHIIPRKAHDCLWRSESIRRRPLNLDQEASQLASQIRQSLICVNNYEDSKDQALSTIVGN